MSFTREMVGELMMGWLLMFLLALGLFWIMSILF